MTRKIGSEGLSLKPLEHLSSLPGDAKLLRKVIEKAEREGIIAEFADNDRAAIRAKKRFILNRSLFAVSLSVLMTDICLYFLMKNNTNHYSEIGGAFSVFLIITSVGSLIVFLYFVYRSYDDRDYRYWHLMRSKAEGARRKYFDIVCMNSDEAAKNFINYINSNNDLREFHNLRFNYFLKYQLDLEIQYYEQRLKAFRSGPKLNLIIIIFALTLSIASFLLGRYSHNWLYGLNLTTADLFFFTIFLFLTIFSAKEYMVSAFGNSRNALRNEVALNNLLKLRHDVDNIRQELTNRRYDRVDEFFKQVNDQISVEHTQWQKLEK